LRQAQAIDNYRKGWSPAEFEALPKSEITDDWSAVPLSELERDCTAHLDVAGLRYYLPALMLSLLDHYEDPDVGHRRHLCARSGLWISALRNGPIFDLQ
jgi:hypothetical protein